jgi:hypothetical protein
MDQLATFLGSPAAPGAPNAPSVPASGGPSVAAADDAASGQKPATLAYSPNGR